MTHTTIKPSKSIQKYLDIIKTGLIQEREIISMRSLMNKNKEAASLIFDEMGNLDELAITEDQARKGYDWLMDQWKTQTGTERKNNPFGQREQRILENYSHITLNSLYNAGNGYHDSYLPLYNVYGNDTCFEYYVCGGIVHIVG